MMITISKWNAFLVTASILLFAILGQSAFAKEPENVLNQKNRFESSIQKFEAQDKANPPQLDGILFVGSSSIRIWDTEASFPCHKNRIIKRGFGGSQTSDVLYFFDRVVAKYKPSKIVFYCGDNDIAQKKTPEQVLQDFDTFLKRTKAMSPKTEVIYLPIKQSVSRVALWDKMQQVNKAIEKRAARNRKLHYCDTIPLLLNSKNELDPKYLQKDGLHLSKEGYQKWTELVKTYLDD